MDVAAALPPYAHVTQEAVQCAAQASSRYGVPELLLHAILKKENGRVGTESRNRDGSFDLGPAQINTIWLKQLSAYGITRKHLRDDFCTNLYVSAYILADYNRIKKGDWFKTLMAYNIGPYNWGPTRTRIGHAYASDVVKYWWGFQNFVDARQGVSRQGRPDYAQKAVVPDKRLSALLLSPSKSVTPPPGPTEKPKNSAQPLVFEMSAAPQENGAPVIAELAQGRTSPSAR